MRDPSTSTAPSARFNPKLLIHLVVVALVFSFMLSFTWRTWPEPVVDFGRELYVPWQLSEGKALYRDIAYFNGPLSPYFNALLFRVLGTSLLTLVVANIAILGGIVLMFHRLAARMSDELSSTVACIAFLTLLAIGQTGTWGNYNFVTPYSHEITHGIALSLAAIMCLTKFSETRKIGWIAGSGALVCMVFLTKPEVSVASAGATGLGVVLTLRGSKRWLTELLLFFACAIAIVLVALALLCIPLRFLDAVGAMIGSWRWALDSRINGMEFYQRVRGTFDPGETARVLILMSLGYAVVFGIPALIARVVRCKGSQRLGAFAGSVGAVVILLIVLGGWVRWEEVGRPLIVVVVAFSVFSILFLLRKPPSPDPLAEREPENGTLRVVFSVFSLLLLLKIALHVQFYHYGFALAAPALVLTVVVFVGAIPSAIDRAGGCGAIARGAAIGAIAVTIGIYVRHEFRQTPIKTTLVGSGPDAFYADPRKGEPFNRALAVLDRLPPDATLAVVPEGAMVNYLSHRPNPTPYIVLMPPEVTMFGAQKIAQSFGEHPPNYVLLMQSDLSDYGYRAFPDYAKPIADWFTSNYTGVAQDQTWVLFRINQRR